MPIRRSVAASSRRVRSRSVGSRFDSGSSRSSTRGSGARARARATRCCWPPEISAIRRRSKPARSTLASAAATRSWTWTFGSLPRLEPERHVLAHREMRKKGVVLEDHAEVALAPAAGSRSAVRRPGSSRDRRSRSRRRCAAGSSCRCPKGRGEPAPRRAARLNEMPSRTDLSPKRLPMSERTRSVEAGVIDRSSLPCAAPWPRTVRSQVAIHSCPFAAASASSYTAGCIAVSTSCAQAGSFSRGMSVRAGMRKALLGGERLRLDRTHELEELERRGAVRRAGREGHRVVDHRRAAGRETVAERHPLLALEQDVGELPHRHLALAAHHLLVQEGGIGDVLLGLGIEPRQPVEAARRRAGLALRLRQHHGEDRAHDARGDRIADQHAAGEARLQEIVPVARGFRLGNELLVVNDDRQGAKRAEVEVACAARALGNSLRPRRPVGREEARRGGAGEDRVRPTEPDVALRIGLSPSGPGRRPPASPCRASARRAPGCFASNACSKSSSRSRPCGE